MDESMVFGHVIDELEARDYHPLVHVPGSHQDTYVDVLDRCETHQITIGGRYPVGRHHAEESNSDSERLRPLSTRRPTRMYS